MAALPKLSGARIVRREPRLPVRKTLRPRSRVRRLPYRRIPRCRSRTNPPPVADDFLSGAALPNLELDRGQDSPASPRTFLPSAHPLVTSISKTSSTDAAASRSSRARRAGQAARWSANWGAFRSAAQSRQRRTPGMTTYPRRKSGRLFGVESPRPGQGVPFSRVGKWGLGTSIRSQAIPPNRAGGGLTEGDPNKGATSVWSSDVVPFASPRAPEVSEGGATASDGSLSRSRGRPTPPANLARAASAFGPSTNPSGQ
jgi:hypothetical protein